jgi:hypothetical protein
MVVFDLKQFSTRQRLHDVLSAGTMSSSKYKQRWRLSSRRAQRTFHDVIFFPEDDMHSHAGSMCFQEADVLCVESSFTTPVRSPLVSLELLVCVSLHRGDCNKSANFTNSNPLPFPSVRYRDQTPLGTCDKDSTSMCIACCCVCSLFLSEVLACLAALS